MNHEPSRNEVVNAYIAGLSPEIQPLFLAVRACVLEAAPQFDESIKWKDCLVYGLAKNHIQTVVGKGRISLIFFGGAAFADAHGLLEGEGKDARTMRIASEDFDRAALTDYVRQSVQLRGGA
jgi:hypothetical protein